MYNDHPWDLKIVAVVERWSLFSGHLCSKVLLWDIKMLTGGRYSEVVVSSGLTVFGYNDLGYNEHQVITWL